LARAARRLAGLDINRGAAGGYRLQLELALLESPVAGTARPITDQSPIAAASAPAQVPAANPQPKAISVEPPPAPAPKPQPKAIPVERDPVATAVPPAPAPATPSSPPSPLVGDGDLAAVLAAWPEIVVRIGRNPANKPLIEACRPVEVQGATIVLGFPETKGFLREKAELRRTAFEAEIGAVLGKSVAVRCVVSNVEVAPPPQIDLVEQARRVFEDDLLDVAEVE
jgi:hypothetical protein